MPKWLVGFFAGFVGLAPAIGAQPTVSAVLNAASYDAAISPGCWVSVMGSGLADSTVTADATPLPTSLGGTTVTVGGVAAQLLYVSPAQINLVIPINTVIPDDTVVPLVVTSQGTAGQAYNLRLLDHAPAVFTADGSGTGPALVFKGDLPADTISPGDTVTLYATGLGLTAGESGTVTEEVEAVPYRP